MNPKTTPPQTAVWYFLGATFVLISPTLLFRGADVWVNIVTLVVGIALLAMGIAVFIREQQQRRASRDETDPR